jgi:hypothetical protein
MTRTTLEEASASMSPIIRIGDELTLAATAAAPRGAVVAYLDVRRLIAHRLLAWRADALLLKGDANRDADPPIEASRYCGEIVAVRRSGRTLDLTSRRWRIAGRLLTALHAAPIGRRLRWLVTRAACHALGRCVR